MSCDLDVRITETLRLWQESGAAFEWVEAHQGQWNHEDWLDLLLDLALKAGGRVPSDVVGAVLERLKAERVNLRRWLEAGEAHRWVSTHQGLWEHQDWLSLLKTLRFSAYWPIDADQLGQALEEARLCWCNLRRWKEAGAAHSWVTQRQGVWNHDDWQELLQELRQSPFWPIHPDSLGQLLEATATEWRNLRHWQESGAPLRWVRSRQGYWTHSDFLALLGTFQWSRFWPVDPVAVGQVLADVRTGELKKFDVDTLDFVPRSLLRKELAQRGLAG